MLGDEFGEAQSLVAFPHKNQTAVGGDARSLEIDLRSDEESQFK